MLLVHLKQIACISCILSLNPRNRASICTQNNISFVSIHIRSVLCIIMPAIDCDNGWPAFDECMPFWQPSCIINFCLVIVFILLWKINFLSLSLSLSLSYVVLSSVQWWEQGINLQGQDSNPQNQGTSPQTKTKNKAFNALNTTNKHTTKYTSQMQNKAFYFDKKSNFYNMRCKFTSPCQFIKVQYSRCMLHLKNIRTSCCWGVYFF